MALAEVSSTGFKTQSVAVCPSSIIKLRHSSTKAVDKPRELGLKLRVKSACPESLVRNT